MQHRDPSYVPAPRPRMIDPQDLLSRLEKARKTGDAWSARCPAHDDKDPSLSVRFDPDGMVLIHCHAGCNVRDVLAAMGLTLADLYPDGALYRDQPGGMRSRLSMRERWSAEDQLRHEQMVLDMAAGARRRGERLSASDLERERKAYRAVKELTSRLTRAPE